MSERKLRSFSRVFPVFGLVGSILVCLAVIVVGLTYKGKASETYSLLNHFISELGQRGVSRNAWLFNATLVASGFLFVPFCVGLGLVLRGWWGYLGMVIGALAGLCLAGVGVFPMDNLAPHIQAAMWFFRFGLATTLLFGIAIISQVVRLPTQGRANPTVPVPKSASVFSLLAFAAYAAFLVLAGIPGASGGSPLDPTTIAHRPKLWLLAMLEWAVFFATVAWFLGVSLLIMVGRGRGSTSR